MTLLRLGRVDEAETLFRHAVVVGDGHAGATRNLALIDELRRRRAEDDVVTPNVSGAGDRVAMPPPRAGGEPDAGTTPAGASQTASRPAVEKAPKGAAQAPKKAKGKQAKAMGTVSGRRKPVPKRPPQQDGAAR